MREPLCLVSLLFNNLVENCMQKTLFYCYDHPRAHWNQRILNTAVQKKVAEKMKAVEQEKTNGDKVEAHIMSIFQKFAAGKDGKVQISNATVDKKPVPTASTLKSLLKHVENTKIGG
jgi:hypothetical protein